MRRCGSRGLATFSQECPSTNPPISSNILLARHVHVGMRVKKHAASSPCPFLAGPLLKAESVKHPAWDLEDFLHARILGVIRMARPQYFQQAVLKLHNEFVCKNSCELA